MMRAALISPLQNFTLAIKNHVQNESLSKLGVEAYELQPLVYSSLIQAGLEKIVLSSETKLPIDLPSHVASRILRDETRSYERCIEFSSSVLADKIRESASQDSTDKLPYLWGFLAEVLYALRNRRPIVTFFDIPDVRSVSRSLPPELSIPIANLLGHLKEATVGTGALAVEANVRDVALYEEILADELYRGYGEKHTALELSEKEIALIGEAIVSDVIAMKLRHQALRVERIGVSTLTFSAKFIDTILFKVPGKLGEELALSAAEYLKDRQRLVIYKFTDLPSRIFSARLNYAVSGAGARSPLGGVQSTSAE
jgi:hypothetical protein